MVLRARGLLALSNKLLVNPQSLPSSPFAQRRDFSFSHKPNFSNGNGFSNLSNFKLPALVSPNQKVSTRSFSNSFSDSSKEQNESLGEIVVAGGGIMGKSIVEGLLQKGIPASSIHVMTATEKKHPMWKEMGISCGLADPKQLENADVIILGMKPQQFPDFVEAAKEVAIKKNALVFTLMAGVGVDAIKNLWGVENVVRSMPNTAAAIQLSTTALYLPKEMSDDHTKAATFLSDAIGTTIPVSDENEMHAFTALAGSGPGFIAYDMHKVKQAIENKFSNQADAQAEVLNLFEEAMQPGAVEKNPMGDSVTPAISAAIARSQKIAEYAQKKEKAPDLPDLRKDLMETPSPTLSANREQLVKVIRGFYQAYLAEAKKHFPDNSEALVQGLWKGTIALGRSNLNKSFLERQKDVTSPNGTTQAGLKEIIDAMSKSAFIEKPVNAQATSVRRSGPAPQLSQIRIP